jgi:SNF2 family DNA or RNA helicase
LNMQDGGRYIVWYTLPWSRELYDQFNCRLSRRGQGNEVKVFRLMSGDTVDDAVAEALRTKLDTREVFLDILERLKS